MDDGKVVFDARGQCMSVEASRQCLKDLVNVRVSEGLHVTSLCFAGCPAFWAGLTSLGPGQEFIFFKNGVEAITMKQRACPAAGGGCVSQ